MAIPSTLETGETRSLIASDKVEGTAVYRSNGWSLLKFSPRLDGYEINISEQQLTEILHP